MILAHVEVGENIRNVAIRINRYLQRTIIKNRVSFIVWGRAVVQIELDMSVIQVKFRV